MINTFIFEPKKARTASQIELQFISRPWLLVKWGVGVEKISFPSKQPKLGG